jgi:hypothetical protein
MNNFMGPLTVSYIDGRHWCVVDGFTYRVGDPQGRYFITIPRGFVTDFASMPLNIVFRSPGGKWDKPAVVHDLLYRRGWIEHEQHRRPITRAEADQVFREAMEVAGVDPIRRTLIYAGVRLGGGKTWNAYREAERVEKVS